MNNLVELQDGEATTSSRQVAEYFGKQHKDVLEVIQLKINTAENSALLNWFTETAYHATNGKPNKEYLMNRDGFTFITMGFKGKRADELKINYIAAFNEMEKILKSDSQLRLPQNNVEMLQVVQSATAETNKRVDELSNQFTELKNEFGLPSKVAGKLKSYGAHKVYEHLGGSKSNAYKEISRKVFSEMWHDFKMHFGDLRSYHDLPLSQLEEGYTYINNWQPSTNTKIAISDLNAQVGLNI